MDQHYSAFISYKHAPADIAAASEIQKRLERFHVPAAIRKTGLDQIVSLYSCLSHVFLPQPDPRRFFLILSPLCHCSGSPLRLSFFCSH